MISPYHVAWASAQEMLFGAGVLMPPPRRRPQVSRIAPLAAYCCTVLRDLRVALVVLHSFVSDSNTSGVS